MNNPVKWLLPLAVFFASVHAQAQRSTIPGEVAAGAVNRVATVPSGQPPSVADVLRDADVVVVGTIGEARSYLSDDQHDVYTDYSILDHVLLYSREEARHSSTQKQNVVPPALSVTQLGGTVMVNGVAFNQKEEALPPLTSGTRVLLLLHREDSKYLIAHKYYGAFGIHGGRLMPLAAKQSFAPEYRDVNLSNAVDKMMRLIGTQRP